MKSSSFLVREFSARDLSFKACIFSFWLFIFLFLILAF
jgi:hypothetical protein